MGAAAHTITTPEELYIIRKQGDALENEERHEGIRSNVGPLRVDSDVFSAIQISGPKDRLDDERIGDDLLDQLYDAVNIITVRYVYE